MYTARIKASDMAHRPGRGGLGSSRYIEFTAGQRRDKSAMPSPGTKLSVPFRELLVVVFVSGLNITPCLSDSHLVLVTVCTRLSPRTKDHGVCTEHVLLGRSVLVAGWLASVFTR